MQIKDSVVLVTGANRGIGRALLAEFLARDAARAYAAARRPEALEPVTAADPDRVVPLVLDITSPQAIGAAVQAAPDVTVLVNNAGVVNLGHLIDMEFDAVENVLRTNVLGPLRMVRAFAPVIEHNGGGAIVNVISIGAFGGTPGMGGYPASKAALNLMTQAFREDLVPRGITVHGVFPGPVETDMLAQALSTAPDLSTYPTTTPQEVARAVLDGLERGNPEIFPDPVSREIGETWARDPKDVERRLTRMR